MRDPKALSAKLDALIGELASGDVRALSRCITLSEDRDLGAAVRRRILPLTGRAGIVGFTGAPGVGKSTLVDAYIAELRRAGLSVAIAAVDPSSPMTGGAVLGDRVRMHRHTADPGFSSAPLLRAAIWAACPRAFTGRSTSWTPQAATSLSSRP